MSRYSVAIVGCGLGGVAAALAIQRAGHQVTVFEKAESPKEVGAGIQLPYNCTRILSKWGILSQVASFAVRPSNVILRRYSDGQVLFRRSLLARINEAGDEIPHLLIHRADFLRVLMNQASSLGALFRFGSTIIQIDFVQPAIKLLSEEWQSFDVIFGADGLNSYCRHLLFGDEVSPRLSGDVAYRLTVQTGSSQLDEELTALLQDSNINCWMGPKAHVVCYQLREDRLLNVVVVIPNLPQPSTKTTQPEKQELKAFLADWDPHLRKLIDLAEKVLKTRLSSSYRMASWSHPKGKFALLGDACHASLPYLAQGAAQALEDAAVLESLFLKLDDDDQVREIIQAYESVRKPRTSRIIEASEARGAMYQLPDGVRQQERDMELAQTQQGHGYPRCLEDPAFQSWLLDYDVDSATEAIFEQQRTFC